MQDKVYTSKKTVKNICLKCIGVALLYLIGHVYFSPILYVAVFATFALFVWDSRELLPIVLFFIPLARIMKFSPDGMTMMNMAILCALAMLLTINKKIGVMEAIICLSFIILLLFKNLLSSFGFPFSYLRIVLLFALIPQFIYVYRKGEINLDLNKISQLSFWGIAFSSLVGWIYMENDSLLDYIVQEDKFYFGETVVNRFCGLSGDPNYFSSLIAFSLALQLYSYARKAKVSYIVNAIVLSIVGILTLSKMFLLMLVILWCIGVFTIITIKVEGEEVRKKRALFIFFMGAFIFLLFYYFVESGYYEIILFRFGDQGASSYTSGRTDIWKNYFAEIFGSISILFIGAKSNADVVMDHLTHNTIVQIFWKIGVMGAIIVYSWYAYLYKMVRNSLGYSQKSFINTLVMLVAWVFPIFALDKFFFDEFYWFYITYLLCRTERINES